MSDSDSDSGQRAADYAPAEVDFTPKPDFDVLFDGLQAEEELGRPFLFELDISTGQLQKDASKLIGSQCCIWLYQQKHKVDGGGQTPAAASDEALQDTDESDKYFHGIVTRVTAAGLSGGAYRYKIELRPWIFLLSHETNCKIFQKKSAFEIVTQVFRDGGFSDFEDKRQGGAGDAKLEYTVQYNETSLDFVTRLMEQYGFYYYFKYSKTAHTLVIADDQNAHDKLEKEVPFEYDKTEMRAVDAHVWEWSVDHGLNSGKWTAQDYNFETPNANIQAKTVKPEGHQYGNFEVYEYPGTYGTSPDGDRHADVRMQSVMGRRQIFSGQSNSRDLHAGWRFKLTSHPEPTNNQEYLIIQSVTTVGSAEGTPTPDTESPDTYRVTIQAIPGDTPYRLQRHTPRPMIRGPQTAKVVGEAGQEITTDNYGRIKVKFHWDRSDTQDSERTCWMRVSQTWGGGTFGSMVIPRVGQEVIVNFMEGNPDRPVVSGVVYNADNSVPHSLPANKTRTTLKSNSSPGGGGSNELHFEDNKGAEEVYIHAERDFRREVKHDEIVTITNDHTTTVTTGNDSLTVQAGNHTISISAGKSSTTAAQSITLTVGGNSVTIDPSGVTIKGASITLQAEGAVTITGASVSIN